MVPTRLRSLPSLYQPEQPDPQAQQGQRDLPDPVDLRVQMGLTALTVQLDLPDLRGLRDLQVPVVPPQDLELQVHLQDLLE